MGKRRTGRHKQNSGTRATDKRCESHRQKEILVTPFIAYGSTHLSLGVIVGVPAFLLVIASALAVALWAARHKFDAYNDGVEPILVFGGLFVATVTLLGAAVSFYPYSGQYHHWQNISGTVTSTNSRFLGDGKSTSQKFVVTFAGSSQQFGCNDTRCATVRKGDDLTITCKRSWQWFGTPAYDCNFVSLKEVAS